MLTVAEVNEKIVYQALDRKGQDFEDNIQMACAQAIAADYIITRNIRDYHESPMPAVTPAQYLAMQG